MQLVVIVLLTIATAIRSDWTDCQLPCRCKWTSGKKTALCSSSGLNTLPNISSDIQVLDLQNNSITYLKSEAFYSIGLVNLQKIFMKNTTLTVLHREAFKNLKILIEVDLSDNQLSLIPPGTFAGNERLKVLILNGNPLRELSLQQFPNLPHLRSLEIENCKLQEIHRDAFINLYQLEVLSLRRNALETLSDNVFRPIHKLKSLALENNPWKCDCTLRSLRNWFLASKLSSFSLICTEPESVKNKQWADVEPQQFACSPSVRVFQKMVQRDVGENATLNCLAKGDPEPEVTWLFNGYPLDSRNTTNTDQSLIIELDEGVLEKWVNVTLVNLTDANSGEYSCVAKNLLGVISQNVSLVLPQVVTATTLSKAHQVSPVLGLVCGGAVTVVFCIILGLICGLQRKRRINVQKSRMKGSVSLLDQEKKLLDISIASTTGESPGAWNSEMMRVSDSEARLIENSPSIPLSSLESRETLHSYKDQAQGVVIPLVGTYSTAVSVYPPPPEFSSGVMPASGFGNIYISVSVSQDPYSDIQRYPDLLDIPYKGSQVSSTSAGSSMSSCSLPSVSYATLPRRPLRQSSEVPPTPPVNDKLGPRVTVEGSSILYHPEDKDIIPLPPLPTQCSSFTDYVSL